MVPWMVPVKENLKAGRLGLQMATTKEARKDRRTAVNSGFRSAAPWGVPKEIEKGMQRATASVAYWDGPTVQRKVGYSNSVTMLDCRMAR